LPIAESIMKKLIRIMLTLLILSYSQILNAWIYPEHRYIGILAIMKLTPEERATLNRMWSDARMGYESRLTESVIVRD